MWDIGESQVPVEGFSDAEGEVCRAEAEAAEVGSNG